MNILIAGANGTTGQELVKRLVSAGHTVKAGVRAPEQIAKMRDMGAKGVLLDLTKPDLFPSALEDVDQVVFTAGSGGKALEAVDRDGAISLIDATARASVPKFVMLSSVLVDEPEKGPDNLQNYFAAKKAADDHLKQSGLDYAIVRPVALTNDDATGKITSGDLDLEGTSIPRADVAHVLQLAIESQGATSEIIEISSGDMPINNLLKSELAA